MPTDEQLIEFARFVILQLSNGVLYPEVRDAIISAKAQELGLIDY